MDQIDKKETPKVQPELSRVLTLFQLVMMGAGMMIGAGVFVATGISIGEAGSGGIMIAFALNGLIAIFSAISFAELSSALPAAGGAYTYIKQAFGGSIGFISGWMNWFALAVAGSLYAITFSTYTIHLLKEIEMFSFFNAHLFLYEKILAVLVALVFIGINFKGVSETGKSSTYIAIAQTVTLGIIGIVGIAVALKNPEALNNFKPFVNEGAGNILIAMGFTYVGFEGFEVIGHAGEEAIDPKRNIPKAILYAVIIVVTTYLLVAFAAVIGAKPVNESLVNYFATRGATGFADSIQHLFPFGGMLLVTFAAIFSSTSALNATIYSSTRVSFAMSRDGQLPKKLALISKKRKIPHIALICSSALILIVAATFDVEAVAAAADIMFLLIFLLINVSVIKIRKELGDELDYGFKMPLFPFIPLMALLAQLLLSFWLFNMQPISWFVIIGWITIGVGVYITYARKHSIEENTYKVFRNRAKVKEGFSVMVSVNDKEHAPTLLKIADGIASKRDGKIEIMNIIHVADTTPLRAGVKFLPDRQKLLREIQIENKVTVPVKRIIRYSHNIPRAIVSVSKERGTDVMIIGWKGYNHAKKNEMGSKVDKVIERIPTDLLVIKEGEKPIQKITKILIPTNGGYHSIMACELANDLVKIYNAQVTIFNIHKGQEQVSRIKRRLMPLKNYIEKGNVNIKLKKSKYIVSEIVKEAKDYDLVIIGATEEAPWQQMIFGKIPTKIAIECSKTVILVKKDLGIKSFAKRWFGKKTIAN